MLTLSWKILDIEDLSLRLIEYNNTDISNRYVPPTQHSLFSILIFLFRYSLSHHLVTAIQWQHQCSLLSDEEISLTDRSCGHQAQALAGYSLQFEGFAAPLVFLPV